MPGGHITRCTGGRRAPRVGLHKHGADDIGQALALVDTGGGQAQEGMDIDAVESSPAGVAEFPICTCDGLHFEDPICQDKPHLLPGTAASEETDSLPQE